MSATCLYLLFSALAVTGINGATVSKRLLNGVGVTPAMGWNNYNSGLQPDAANALNTANAFISLGLKDLGYTYINMDDGWPSMSRDSSGNLVPNPTFFPNGMLNLTTEIHSMGLKFGLYGDSGTQTCSGFPGSQGFEAQDAAQLSEWGVDYWKYDNCNTPSGDSEPRYQLMSNELAAQSHSILYSLCQWGVDSVWTWGASVGNSWRVGGDITNSWSSVASIAAANAPIAQYAQPGGFNDFDMMEIGNGVLSAAEERSHFALWAISKSPLLLGTDLSKIAASSLAVITNQGLTSISQDPLGIAATTFQPSPSIPAPVSGQLYQYWAGPLSDGFVIALIAVNEAQNLNVSFADVPGLGAGTYSWTELYTGTQGSGTGVSANLEEHDIAVFKVLGGGGGVTSTSKSSTVAVPTKTSSIGATSTTTPHTTVASSTATATPTGTVAEWGQCGGIGYVGPTVCASPFTCHVGNPFH